MAGALLRSGSLTEFYPLGAVGKPVYSAASQLRAAIRRRTDAATADILAVPKQNDTGDIIDWYAPAEGNIVPWAAATPEERIGAKHSLEAARKKLNELSGRLLAEDQENRSSSELQVFGKLLAQATQIPGDEHIYLVDGRPVITFWGFHPLDAPPGHDVIGNLLVGGSLAPAVSGAPGIAAVAVPIGDAAAPAAAAIPIAAVVTRRAWWWRWLWLLLLLPLLFFLLIGLKSCGIRVPLGGWLPSFATSSPIPAVPAGHDPVLDSFGKPVLDPAGRPVWLGPDGRQVVYGPDGDATYVDSSGQPLTPQPPDQAADQPKDQTGAPGSANGSDQNKAPNPLQKPDKADAADPTKASDAAKAPDPTAAPESMPSVSQRPDAAEATGAPLTIPESSARDGDTSFLDGGWRSNTGLQDDSGNPLKLGYDFKGGEGAVTMHRSVGSQKQTCTGPAKSAMQDGQLVITQGNIQCPDNTTFSAPRVVCKMGAGGSADCVGVNEDGSTFPVSITR